VTGLWPNTITDIASGKRIPEYDTAQLIATATDGAVTVDEIMQSSVLSKATDKRAQRRRLRAQRIDASDRPNDDARD
jgi:transcriptional regulator with XRE-family HTH domain